MKIPQEQSIIKITKIITLKKSTIQLLTAYFYYNFRINYYLDYIIHHYMYFDIKIIWVF